MIFLFLLQFLKELKSGLKYMALGLAIFIVAAALLLGLSWYAGFLMDKIFNIDQLNPSNYIVYGTYVLISIFSASVFLMAIMIWILMAYKVTLDKIKGNKNG